MEIIIVYMDYAVKNCVFFNYGVGGEWMFFNM